MARMRPVGASASHVVNSLIHGTAWDGGTITYAIASAPPRDGAYAANSVLEPPPALRGALARAVADIESIADIDFVEVAADAATIRIFVADRLSLRTPHGVETIPLGAYGFFPANTAEAGDVWLSPDLLADLSPGSLGYRTLLHELGHALGLKQPDEHGPYGRLPAAEDGPELTVMSGRAAPGAPAGRIGAAPGGHASTFMTADIAALQHVYGPASAAPRDDTYVFSPFERAVQRTIHDGGGRDTYDFSAFTTPLAIDLRPGAFTVTGQEPLLNHAATLSGEAPVWAKGAIHNALRGLIENAVGGRAGDTMNGNLTRNRLEGRDGNDLIAGYGDRDTLDGGRGNDTLLGGAGDDLLLGGPGNDRLAGEAGDDRLNGGDGDDWLTGGGGDDALFGGDGDDTLSGQGGDDSLVGAAGNDVLRGGPGDDTLGGWGEDDSLAGEEGSDSLSGDRGDDTLRGGGGDDTLDGGPDHDVLLGDDGDDILVGGPGRDTLAGGRGDDTLSGGWGVDIFAIAADGGADTILDFLPGVDLLDVPAPAAALASARDTGEGAVLSPADGTTVLLAGVAAATLSATDLF